MRAKYLAFRERLFREWRRTHRLLVGVALAVVFLLAFAYTLDAVERGVALLMGLWLARCAAPIPLPTRAGFDSVVPNRAHLLDQ